MLTAPPSPLTDQSPPDAGYREWLCEFLVRGPDRPIPGDYGGPIAYLTDHLSRATPANRAAVADAVAGLLADTPDADQPAVADLLEILAEVATESPPAVARAAPVVADVLAAPSGQPLDRTCRKALHVLGRCSLPDRNWLPLIRPHLQSADTAFLAYLALDRQHPQLAPPYLPGVLEAAHRAGIPTGLFLFTLEDRRGR